MNYGVGVSTTLETVALSVPSAWEWEIKKGGHGGSGGGHGSSGGGHVSGEGSGSGHGSGEGSGSGHGSGEGSGSRGNNHYYYNGVDYRYGYPVYYQGNRFYPRGMILPVGFIGGAALLYPGHIYHTYTSSDTLYYSEVPPYCGSNSASSGLASGSYSSCIPSSSSLTFTDGGLVTIKQAELESVTYSTLSDSTSETDTTQPTATSDGSSSIAVETETSEISAVVSSSTEASSSSTSSHSVSSISSTSANSGSNNNPIIFHKDTNQCHRRLSILFATLITAGTISAFV